MPKNNTMAAKVIINAKGSEALREAIRKVAYKQGHNNRSRTIVQILEADPEIQQAMPSQKKTLKKSA